MDKRSYSHILILADIEGSRGCGSYRASSFLTRPWAHACAAMARDVDAVIRHLFDAGVQRITVQDFHRSGYNLLPEMIDGRARILCGYRQGPAPGVGSPGDADAVMMIGMHAAAGTNGFLAHTLTSLLAALTVAGRPLAEVELFAAAKMADPWGFDRCGATVRIDADDNHALYNSLIRLCYLSPLAEKTLYNSLGLFNLAGRLAGCGPATSWFSPPGFDTRRSFLYTTRERAARPCPTAGDFGQDRP